MLHIETVEPHTLDLLKRLMRDEILSGFNLVGGTSLSLQLGHRKSIDLDLFSFSDFSGSELKNYLTNNYSDFIPGRENAFTLISEIEGIKVDFIRYGYPLVKDLINEDGIRLYSKEDIAAMKLSAISQTGLRLKDFVDIACLSTEFSLNQMLDLYSEKFNNDGLTLHLIRALSYHEEIDHTNKVDIINGLYSWKSIQKRLYDMIDNPDKIYSLMPFNG
ncbi:MAG: nucleotidyl transferase AbiEii/AbiGii toxin family protein [Tannerellaceae bacterium]|jgi:DNA-binding transcriptional MerR regulator|nr:nucleotidyl transferase AbiEii/AbiGii toxin family protein [Tannerellaceae bacterium]